jgi:N-acetylmuramoyl-L-alanine amidase
MATLIILDGGHGGSDPGAVSPQGVREKDQVLDITHKVKALEAGFGGKIVFSLTRNSDVFVSLNDRCLIANRAKASFFLSIHQNSDGTRTGRGVETYALSAGGPGNKLAHAVQDAMVQNTGLGNRGVKYARFYVLHFTDMSAALIECGFIGTAAEASVISTDAFHQKVALAICQGISRFTGIPFQVAKPPGMYIDSPVSGQVVNSNFNIKGWALNASGVKEVVVSMDGVKLGVATTGFSRPDVDKAFPGYPDGANSGFNYMVDINSLGQGSHTISVDATGNDGTSISLNVQGTVSHIRMGVDIHGVFIPGTVTPDGQMMSDANAVLKTLNTPYAWNGDTKTIVVQ